MKNRNASKTDMTAVCFFRVVFHVVSLLVFDSIVQKSEMRYEMKNESKRVIVDDTNNGINFAKYNIVAKI